MAKRKISALQRFAYLLEAALVIPLGELIRILPWRIARALGYLIGKLLYLFSRRYKKVAMENLDTVFSDKLLSEEEKKRIIRKLYFNVAQGMIEYLKMGSVTPENADRFVEFANMDCLEREYRKGKGVLVVSLHLGNWEYSGSIPAKKGFPIGVIINRQFNPYTDAWLRRIREKRGKMECFYNEVKDLRRVHRHLRKGGILAMLTDQTYYFKPIFVPFFGRTSATADGPARFHLKYGSSILMSHAYKMEDGRYRVVFEGPLEFDLTGDLSEDFKIIMTQINRHYEKYIRAHPEQWFSLLHPRWERTKPEDFDDIDEDPYG